MKNNLKPGVLLGKTFSHTPDEVRSVGLAKACVFQKIFLLQRNQIQEYTFSVCYASLVVLPQDQYCNLSHVVLTLLEWIYILRHHSFQKFACQDVPQFLHCIWQCLGIGQHLTQACGISPWKGSQLTGVEQFFSSTQGTSGGLFRSQNCTWTLVSIFPGPEAPARQYEPYTQNQTSIHQLIKGNQTLENKRPNEWVWHLQQ